MIILTSIMIMDCSYYVTLGYRLLGRLIDLDKIRLRFSLCPG